MAGNALREAAGQGKLKATRIEHAVTGPDGTTIVHRYDAWPKQMQFHATQKRYVLFGGARGPGKTVALEEHILRAMLRWPGIPIVVIRKDLKDLKNTFDRVWRERVPKEFFDPKWGGQHHKGENWYRFFNGSTLILGEGKDWESYKSMTLGMFVIEEANEVDEELFLNVDPALRWTTGKGICKRADCAALGEEYAREHSEHPFYQIVMASNPSPGWLKTRFWEPWKVGKERPNHAFVPATAFDNPSLPPDFIPNLLQNNTATWVQNYIYGDWAAFENMVWPTFNRGLHSWRGPLPEFVRVTGGIDYGGTTQEAHRTAAYLTGETKRGLLVTFWEYSQQGAASKDFFAMITLKTREHRVDTWWADSSQMRANELLRDRNINVQDAARYKGSVKEGINMVHRELQPDATGLPRLFVSTEACPRLVSGIETYQLDPLTGEPVKGQEDDEVNAWRYNIMGATETRSVLPALDIRVVNPAGEVTKPKTSRMMTTVKEQKRARLKETLERLERTR